MASSNGSTDATNGSTDATNGSMNATNGSTDATNGSMDATNGSTDDFNGSSDALNGSTDDEIRTLDAALERLKSEKSRRKFLESEVDSLRQKLKVKKSLKPILFHDESFCSAIDTVALQQCPLSDYRVKTSQNMEKHCDVRIFILLPRITTW